MCVRCKRKSNNAFLSKSSFPGRPPHAIHRIVLANTLFGHAPVQKPETSFKRSHLLCSERASLSPVVRQLYTGNEIRWLTVLGPVEIKADLLIRTPI